MKYQDQLRRPEWKSKRLEILKRDGHKCTKCGAKKSLQVHHIKYVNGKMAWEVPNKYLITLCKKHHEEIHFGKPVSRFVKGKSIETKEEFAFRMALQKEINKNKRVGAEIQKIKRKDVDRIIKFMEKQSETNLTVKNRWTEFKEANGLKNQ